MSDITEHKSKLETRLEKLLLEIQLARANADLFLVTTALECVQFLIEHKDELNIRGDEGEGGCLVKITTETIDLMCKKRNGEPPLSERGGVA